MGENSKIEWTTHTANLWWGCTEVHAGCDNCYARVLSNRYGEKLWGNDVPRRPIKSVWKELLKYQRLAKTAGEMHRVFVGSMMDIFEKSMPLSEKFEHFETTDDLRQELFTQITWGEGGLYPNLMFLFLTKRPSNISKYIPAGWLDEPPKNVMYGTSPVDQKTADTLIPQLLKVSGKRFLSVEPQLGEITFRWAGWHDWKNPKNGTPSPQGLRYNQYDGIKGIDWVIQGGESGHHKRPFKLEWAYKLKSECEEAGIPYFFKQIDKIQPIPEDLMIRQFFK